MRKFSLAYVVMLCMDCASMGAGYGLWLGGQVTKEVMPEAYDLTCLKSQILLATGAILFLCNILLWIQDPRQTPQEG